MCSKLGGIAIGRAKLEGGKYQRGTELAHKSVKGALQINIFEAGKTTRLEAKRQLMIIEVGWCLKIIEVGCVSLYFTTSISTRSLSLLSVRCLEFGISPDSRCTPQI